MPKYLVTADWQVTVGNLAKCDAMLAELLAIADKHQVRGILHCGDVKEVRNPIDMRVANWLVQATQRLRTEKRWFSVLIGNHDMIGMGASTGSCAPLLEAAGARVYSQPTAEITRNGVDDFFFLPYMDDLAAAEKALAEFAQAAEPKKSILLFHQELDACRLNVTANSKSGSALPFTALHAEKYMFCIGGHIHLPQRLCDNVFYVGSPFSMDWGEANQRKRYLLIDTDKKACFTIPSKIPALYDDTYPDIERFTEADFKGATVRVHVVYGSDNALPAVVEKAKTEAQRKYPGAEIVVFPERMDAESAAPDFSASSDPELILDFTRKNKPDHLDVAAERIADYLTAKLDSVGLLRRSTEGVRIKAARAQHFLSYPKLDVTYDKGIAVVTGVNEDWPGRANGVGKTNFLQIPAVALFGRSLKGQTHDGWRSNLAPKNQPTWVELDFDLPDGRSASIRRQRNPHKVTLTIDGQDFSSGLGNKDSQKTLETLTGLTWDVLVNALYIDQQQINALLRGTDKDRKAIFAQFLNLERFSVAQESVKADRKKLQTMLEEGEASLRVVNAELVQAQEFLKSIKPVDVSASAAELQTAIDTLAKADADLIARRKEIADKRKSLAEDIQLVDTDVSDLTTEVGILKGRQQPISNQILKARAMSGDCPTCKQPISQKTLDKCVLGWETSIRKLAESAAKMEGELAVQRQRLTDLRLKDRTLADSLRPLESAQTNAALRVRMLTDSHKKTVEQQTLRDRYAADIEARKRKVSMLTDAARCLSEELDFFDFCIHVFSRDGLPSYMAASLCPRLNAASEYYSRLISEGEIRVRFDMAGGDIDVQVDNLHGGDKIEDQSQGESRIASLIVALSLRQVMVPTNLIIMDEPGEGLDATNAQIFARALRTIAPQFGCLLVSTHNPHIAAELSDERQIQIVKKDGVSKLV